MTSDETCIYPGCERPRGAAASAGRAAARLLRPRAAQRADRAPGAPTARIRPSPTKRRRRVADEAYRAVFLRVHPTGKMVLSLTTDADGKEPEYAALVGARARRAGARRQGRHRRHRPLRRRPRLQHEPVRRRRRGDLGRHRQDPRQGAAARGHGARRAAGGAHSGPTARGWRATAPTRRRSRRSRTSRSTRTGRARCRRASRAGSTPRRSTATSTRPCRRARPRPRRGPSAPPTARSTASCRSSVCVTVAVPETMPSALTARSNASGFVVPASVSSPSTRRPVARALHARRSGTRCPGA